MTLHIQLGRWDLRLEGFPEHTLRRVAELFPGRTGQTATPGLVPLRCSLAGDTEELAPLLERLQYEGAGIRVSGEVFLRYAYEGPLTRGRIGHTALFELDERRPDECRVWLERRPPRDPAAPRRIVEPEPEAFLYPMLVEWLRRHEACFVHCGAVALEGRTVMLSGPPGSGKSTQVLRMLQRGAGFLADDLAILSREGGELWAYPFREVANVNAGTLQRFSAELGQLGDSPLRGDGKYCVDIGRTFGQRAVARAAPGVILHLHPDPEPWKRPRPAAEHLRGLDRMAWFASRAEANERHFWLLTDWLLACEHHDLSQGYLAEHLDVLLADLRAALRAGAEAP